MFEKVCNLEIFKGIEESVVENIINICETIRIPAGKNIITEGEEPNGEGYIIKHGDVSISINNKMVTTLGIGDIFGEIALLNEEKRTATVTSITDVELIVLNLNNLIDMINNDDNTINKTIMKRIEENLEREISI